MTNSEFTPVLTRIAEVLEKFHPPKNRTPNFEEENAFVWKADQALLSPVQDINRIPINLLKGIDQARDILLDNTIRFANGFSANNALLWGARGSGKSSLVKSIHWRVSEDVARLILIEIQREDICSLTNLLKILRDNPSYRFILFCDDLSFDQQNDSYKSLKAILEGGIEGKPKNVLFYATSNRRHLMPRDMIENEKSNAISPKETVDEKISLSDRFGLWLGFHNCDQDTYLEMVSGYAEAFEFDIKKKELYSEAIEWSATRGARSGRVAWQFIQDLGGRLRKQVF